MNKFIQRLRYGKIADIGRKLLYLIKAIGHVRLIDHRWTLYCESEITLLGNGPAINSTYLPTRGVIICNHFWRHDHYPKITHGWHVISDKNFLRAADLDSFLSRVNYNLIIVCSSSIRSKLLEKGYRGLMFPVNYSGFQRIWDMRQARGDLFEVVYTGSTVVVDIAFPLVSVLRPPKLIIIGVGLDYGKSNRDYAFDVKNSQLAPDWYMENLWKGRAEKSVALWLERLRREGVKVEWRR